MAGMFYSQQEAAEKLGVTEEEVKQLARDGKLREFRDGPNVMFKIDEVEGLAAGSGLGLDDFSGASEPAEGSDELDPILEMNTIDDLPGADEELSLPPGDTASNEAIDDIIFDDDLDLTPVPDATSEESPPPLASEEETVSVTPAEDAADEDLEIAVKRVSVMLEPLAIVVIGSVIGVVAIALLLPVFKMSTIAGG